MVSSRELLSGWDQCSAAISYNWQSQVTKDGQRVTLGQRITCPPAPLTPAICHLRYKDMILTQNISTKCFPVYQGCSHKQLIWSKPEQTLFSRAEFPKSIFTPLQKRLKAKQPKLSCPENPPWGTAGLSIQNPPIRELDSEM